MSEIETAVRLSLPYVAVVGTDARWNAEYNLQVRDYGPNRTYGCELNPTRYDLVATALGGVHTRHRQQVDRAATLFDGVRYGDRSATSEQARDVLTLDDSLAGRP